MIDVRTEDRETCRRYRQCLEQASKLKRPRVCSHEWCDLGPRPPEAPPVPGHRPKTNWVRRYCPKCGIGEQYQHVTLRFKCDHCGAMWVQA
jgi:ribosomal protein S27AE